MSRELRDRLGASLWALVSAVGVPLVGADAISARPADDSRQTYRLSFADGSTLKGRRFRTEVRAEVSWRICTGPAAPFVVRGLAHEGDATLEEWIDGEVLVQGRVSRHLLREAGRMLGFLHGCPPPSTDDLDFHPVDGHGWALKTEENLHTLHHRGLLTAERADLLTRRVMADLPSAVSLGVVHHDLCPENLVTNGRGRLISVDNGSMTIGAVDYDLGRVWYRWPMTDDERAAFNAGYREHRDTELPGVPSRFWATVAIVNSARTRLGWSATAAAAALERLDESRGPARASS